MIIVMAQGSQARMRRSIGGTPKQFLEVAGEPIIKRTLRLVDGLRVAVVGRKEWATSLPGTDIVNLQCPGENVVQGIFQCGSLWEDDALFLLGDVVYSRRLLGRILGERTPGVLVWGRVGRPNPVTGRAYDEMYALRLGVEGAIRFVRLAYTCSNLHDVRKLIARQDEFRPVDADDYTDDVDLPEDLPLLPLLGGAVLKEAQ